ncbi:hypothetical protein [Niallia nealsonii]|uniref:hypothetical protein n=1 Tax=Niallia nealsonii TaxID=115979 RepID=UPI0012FEDCD9|nr:hypothetical protein [Niallia nealsonii]
MAAVTPNGRPEKQSTDLLNSYAPNVGKLYGGGLDQLINIMLLTDFTQGAIALEVEPDNDFYHTSSIEIKTVGGTRTGTINAQAVIDIINQQVVTALKQLPILLGRNEGTTETHGTVQWQIYVAGIQSIQRAIKRILEKAYNVVLQVNGKQRSAKLTFHELRVTDRQSEANAEKTETETKIMQRKEDWITNDEAANAMVGHAAVAEPETTSTTEADPLSAFRTDKRGIVSKKTRADEPDDFIISTGDPWAEELAALTVRAKRKFQAFSDDQMELYIERLKDLGELPTRILYYVTNRDDEEVIMT